ncbi:MAG: hydroxymethylbilane synthase [Alphaproteobacteria bacterium]|nr:hydroxymethylbilane synthase [Alphaproteobacteria bacterium]
MTTLSFPIRIGTRNSKLALRQAALLEAALIRAEPTLAATGYIVIVPMQSAGDWKPEQQECSFAAMGGNKGLFAKELEVALLERRIDIAIHSAKDLETVLATGLTLACFLPRDDVRDAFIAPNVTHWRELPAGARVGTSSLRRAVQVLADRPDLVIAPLRGNVDTRLRKLRDGQVDATLLALCGLQRLGLADDCFHPLPTDVMLPAVAQGALAVEMRDEPGALYDLLRRLNCGVTERCVTLERIFLHHLNGSCHTPVAALATLAAGHRINFTALVAQPDGSNLVRRKLQLADAEAATGVASLGTELRAYLPPTAA